MMLSLCTGISFTPPFPGKQVHGALHREKKLCKGDDSQGRVLLWFIGLYTMRKNCVREMTAEVGSFSGHPGCCLVNMRVVPYNRYDAIKPFLLSMLIAPPVAR